MGNPQLLAIENDLVVTAVQTTQLPPIRIKFHQQDTGVVHYRLYCHASSYTPQGFEPFYLYLNDQQTLPNYIYALDFQPTRLTNMSGTSESFIMHIFPYYPTTDVLRPLVELQSSTDGTNYSASAESLLLTIRLEKDKFGPSWECPTWIDSSYASNAGIRSLTGDNQKAVQNASTLTFTIKKASTNNGADPDYYNITFPGYPAIRLTAWTGQPMEKDVTVQLYSYPKLVGTIPIEFSVTDIRGQTTRFTQNITILPYVTFSLTKNNTHRLNGTGSTVVLDFSGQWNGVAGSPAIALSCTSIVAKVQGSSTPFATLTPTLTVSGNNFSFQGNWVDGTGNDVSFDSSKAYNVTITLTDTVKSIDFRFTIPVGTPVISVRDKKVGINKADPACALDVVGDIHANGYEVFYCRGVIPSLDINNCTSVGTYIQPTGNTSAYSHLPPVSIASDQACPVIVEVTGVPSKLVQKLFSLSSDEMFIRIYTGSFGSWKKVTLT